MKALKIIIIMIFLVWLAAIGMAGRFVYVKLTALDTSDPLASSRVELERAKIEQQTAETEKETEAIRLEQEEQTGENAVTMANLRRRERIEQNAGVSWAAAALAITWRLSFPIVFFSGLIGAGVYLYRKPVLFEHGNIRSPVPRHEAAALTREALAVEERKAMVEALAYCETVTRERVTQIIETVKALRPGREMFNLSNQSALPAAPEQQPPGHLPTFAEIFDSRELHGDLILGFEEDNSPRLGKYEAVHSCLIYGIARSGKTSLLRGLIGQTILTEPETRCDVLDPHAARKDSLIGSLPKTKHFHLIDASDPVPALTAFGDELRRRLLSEEATFPPRILLIDELNQLASEPYKPQLAALCEATAQRGRKVNMFLLATAQDVREKKIGDFRASLSSAYFFKGKSAQVKAFLDDPEAAKLYRKHVTRHGRALFSAADEEPRLMMIPECKPNDLKRLEAVKYHADALPVTPGTANNENVIDETPETFDASEVKEEVNVDRSPNVVKFPVDLRTAADLTGKELLTLQEITTYLAPKIAKKEVKLTAIADAVKVDAGFLSKVMRGQKKLPEQLQQRLTQWILKHFEHTQEA